MKEDIPPKAPSTPTFYTRLNLHCSFLCVFFTVVNVYF